QGNARGHQGQHRVLSLLRTPTRSLCASSMRKLYAQGTCGWQRAPHGIELLGTKTPDCSPGEGASLLSRCRTLVLSRRTCKGRDLWSGAKRYCPTLGYAVSLGDPSRGRCGGSAQHSPALQAGPIPRTLHQLCAVKQLTSSRHLGCHLCLSGFALR